MCVCVCVCVCERERERERECVCVCVCVCERERECVRARARNWSTSPELVFTLLMTCFAVLRSFPTSDDIVITAYEGGFATIPCTAPYSHPPATIQVQTSTGRLLNEAQGKAAVPLYTSSCCGILLSLFVFCLFVCLLFCSEMRLRFLSWFCTSVSWRFPRCVVFPVLAFSTLSGFASLGVFHAVWFYQSRRFPRCLVLPVLAFSMLSGFASIDVFHAVWFCQSWHFPRCLVLPVLAFSTLSGFASLSVFCIPIGWLCFVCFCCCFLLCFFVVCFFFSSIIRYLLLLF